MPHNMTYGTATRLTATGATCITSANAALIGVLFQGSATGALSIWAGTTATATAAGVPLGKLVAYGTTGVTANAAMFIEFPAVCSGGFTVNVEPSLDPKIVLFWNPAGGA